MGPLGGRGGAFYWVRVEACVSFLSLSFPCLYLFSERLSLCLGGGACSNSVGLVTDTVSFAQTETFQTC